MIRRLIKLVGALAIAVLFAGVFLGGCTSPNNSAQTEQQANRAYMSQVNEIMDEITGELDEFVSAVSAGDVVAMGIQANAASETLSKISALDVPDDLKDVQQSYVDGANKLKDALDQYLALYKDTENGSFDAATFAERMAEIQSLYNEGVSALQKGDEDAAAL